MNILHYSNLAEEIFDIGWFPNELPPKIQEQVTEFSAFEFRIPLENESQNTLNEIKQLTGNVIAIQPYPKYLTLLEGKTKPQNKIRSYKGLFTKDGNIKNGNYLEKEIQVDNQYSFYLGIAEINNNNKNECLNLASDYVRSFLLFSNTNDILDLNQVIHTLKTCIFPDYDSLWFDYSKVIPVLLAKKLSICIFRKSMQDEHLSLIYYLNNKFLNDFKNYFTKLDYNLN